MNKWISIVVCVILCGVSSCQSTSEVAPMAWEGTWAAVWESPFAPQETLQGSFHFGKHGEVHIQALGSDQSMLLSDTTEYTATWHVNENQLIIGNSHALVYQVLSQSPTHIKLLLFDEIHVNLTRFYLP
ncbi:hypothetical protein QWY31_08700 [Cytophagales bacterium LB-30]|uniref:Lipocalin-like domain-containing protein n=1 Tax=Shiella aurantiaca TaxID=3058365 RepID=A0ABT8F5C1_9BACT|nr:hypothetical protein [Shiella aurantiaca]MDN4165578.1 hypothetical protein [Shiella aurantiaca]